MTVVRAIFCVPRFASLFRVLKLSIVIFSLNLQFCFFEMILPESGASNLLVVVFYLADNLGVLRFLPDSRDRPVSVCIEEVEP